MDRIERAVAYALWIAQGAPVSHFPSDLQDLVRLFLNDLEGQGFAVVPVEPTEAMAEIGFSVSAEAIRSNRLGLDKPLNPPVEAYKAMVWTAKEKPSTEAEG